MVKLTKKGYKNVQIILRNFCDKNSGYKGQVKEGAKWTKMKFISHTLKNSILKNYQFV